MEAWWSAPRCSNRRGESAGGLDALYNIFNAHECFFSVTFTYALIHLGTNNVYASFAQETVSPAGAGLDTLQNAPIVCKMHCEVHCVKHIAKKVHCKSALAARHKYAPLGQGGMSCTLTNPVSARGASAGLPRGLCVCVGGRRSRTRAVHCRLACAVTVGGVF